MKRSNVVFLAIGIAVVLSIIISNPPIEALMTADLRFLLLGFVLSNISAVLWTFKWKALLSFPFRQLFPIQMAGNAISSLTQERLQNRLNP